MCASDETVTALLVVLEKNGGSAARQELKFGHAKIERLLPAIKGTIPANG
jgi:hypothetical protein